MDEEGRSVVRGGWGKFYQKTPFAFLTAVGVRRVFGFVHGAVPGQQRRCGSVGGTADRSVPRQRPSRNRALLNQMFPAGTKQKNTGAVNFDHPDRSVPYQPGQHRLRAPDRHRQLAASVDYIGTI
jgi:hypothetical protein